MWLHVDHGHRTHAVGYVDTVYKRHKVLVLHVGNSMAPLTTTVHMCMTCRKSRMGSSEDVSEAKFA